MKTFWKKTKIIIFGFLGFILLLAATGTIYQYASTKIDEKKYPPPGKLIDIGGYRLHIQRTGNGGPIVVLDAGLGYDSLEWSLVQPEIAKFTEVCSYDRAGYGWSEESPNPRTSVQIVEELHTLLANAKISPPYILVGHSFGGVNVQLYTKRYPNEVIGLVLADSGNEMIERLPQEPKKTWIEKWLSSPEIVLFETRLGIHRLLLHSSKNMKKLQMFPESIRDMILANQSSSKQAKACLQENSHFLENIREMKNSHLFFGNLPLTVIASGQPFITEGMSQEWVQYYQKFFPVWRLLQQDLATRSSKGKLLIAEKSDHMIPWHQPEIIVEAVKQIVENFNEEGR